MAEISIVLLFILGFTGIAAEEKIGINKTAIALLTGIGCWTCYALFSTDVSLVVSALSHHLGSIAEILFFLLGAMTIVELIDAHQGFELITDKIDTRKNVPLLWITGLLSFFLSAVLDNLTTAIVMVSLCRKLIANEEQRKYFAGLIIIAANAGGAWSPIGDVTTTMLWTGGQVSSVNIIRSLFLPSLLCLIVPLAWFSIRLKKKFPDKHPGSTAIKNARVAGSKIMLILGIGSLIFVPVFKVLTGLPPYAGMLLALSIVWMVSELIHSGKDEEERKPFSAVHALSRIDTPSILFFLGILLAVSALESNHILRTLASWLDAEIRNRDLIVYIIGLLSSLVDNVPLVAASMGMYDLQAYPVDSKIWEFIAYCAGTGGSILIIGSAAGVAIMGIEKIPFGWYLKQISLIALISYSAGALLFLFLYPFSG